jgi:prepilin-type N-terminal cleavage/methylation domain-containing protein
MANVRTMAHRLYKKRASERPVPSLHRRAAAGRAPRASMRALMDLDARARSGGFTLVEVLIVVAVVAILAAVAVPNLVTSRTAANERAVLATLRTIATAEAQVITARTLDADRDGLGEALGLSELAGTVPVRTTGRRLQPSALSVALGMPQGNGFVSAKGYLIALYLPDAGGTGLLATPANFASIDSDGAEHSWTCLAWPATRGSSGSATFFVNQEGDILVARRASYSGSAAVPPGGAGLCGVGPATVVGGVLASNTIGADGNLWLPVQ